MRSVPWSGELARATVAYDPRLSELLHTEPGRGKGLPGVCGQGTVLLPGQESPRQERTFSAEETERGRYFQLCGYGCRGCSRIMCRGGNTAPIAPNRADSWRLHQY